jgi:8-oxo-dGTP diphosphatase
MSEARGPRVHVVAGVLRDSAGRVLIAQRPAGKPHAGFWEFPGGKQHPGESEPQSLARELREELGIEVEISDLQPHLRIRHDYVERSVELAVWRVGRYAGEVRSAEGQELRWVEPAALTQLPLLPADGPIVDSLLRPLASRMEGPAVGKVNDDGAGQRTA